MFVQLGLANFEPEYVRLLECEVREEVRSRTAGRPYGAHQAPLCTCVVVSKQQLRERCTCLSLTFGIPWFEDDIIMVYTQLPQRPGVFAMLVG